MTPLPGSIRRKFSAVFLLTLAVCAAAGAAVLDELKKTRQATNDFIHLGAQQLELAQRLEAKLYRAQTVEDLFLSRAQLTDLEHFRLLAAEIANEGKKLAEALHGEARAGVVQQLAHVAEYAKLVESEAEVTLGQKQVADPGEFRALLVKRGQALGAAQVETQKTLERVLAAGPVYAVRVEKSFVRLGLWMLVLLVAVAGGAVATWSVGNRIVRQVSQMAATVGEITTHDHLDRRLTVGSADELGTLALAFNAMLSTQQANAREREAAYRELRAASEELRRSHQKLIESDKLATIGQLSAGVAHEVNNPATSVIGNLEFLRLELEPLFAEIEKRDAATAKAMAELREALVDSIGAMQRISNIVRDLGAFARKSDDMELVPVEEPIEVALKMANFEVKYRAEVVRDFQPVPHITGNRGRLQQVFLNLIINAAQAIPKGNLHSNKIRVATRLINGSVEVELSDTGKGIAREHLSRIFDPFFTTKAAGEGTGLGLAITNDIVHQHGGEISVESEVGRGTTFRLRFPARA